MGGVSLTFLNLHKKKLILPQKFHIIMYLFILVKVLFYSQFNGLPVTNLSELLHTPLG